MNYFVFYHVGADLTQPSMLVCSIRAVMPEAHIIQCTDLESNIVAGVDEYFRQKGSLETLMLDRIRSFSNLGLRKPAIYLDTDMLLLKPIEINKILSSSKVLLCRRHFNRDSYFNIRFKDLDLSEYKGRTLDEVYPFLACTTICSDSSFWSQIEIILQTLNNKFLVWYGDQEALRIWWLQNSLEINKYLSESEFACLPEEFSRFSNAKIIHFKGPKRKAIMIEFYSSMYKNIV